jgi:hypothetical protein
MMTLEQLTEALFRTRSVRKFYTPITEDRILDDDYTPEMFHKDKAYFVLTLSEMYLRDRREYLRDFIPVCIVVSEFNYGNQKKVVVPFFVSNQLLNSVESLVKDQGVEYYNTTVAGPLPYMGDNVCIFVGLFRLAVSDLSKTLIGFIEQITDAFSIPGFSSYLNLAKVITGGLPDLLGMKDMEFRFGTRDEFTGSKRKGHSFQQGYLAYINCPEQDVKKEQLWVKNGRLMKGKSRDNHSRYCDNDYCLLKIEHLMERDDYQSLPFYDLWEKIKEKIWDGDIEKARKELLPRLAREVALSPDLIRDDRFHVQQMFKLNFECEVDSYFKLIDQSSKRAPHATRGSDERLTPRGKIQRMARIGNNISKDVGKAMSAISNKWEHIPHLQPRTKNYQLTRQQFKEQLHTIKEISIIKKPDPNALAESLVADSISFQTH